MQARVQFYTASIPPVGQDAILWPHVSRGEEDQRQAGQGEDATGSRNLLYSFRLDNWSRMASLKGACKG
jgi:hypothetical protein